ncbi:MAG: 5-bromo-4-chloroindolyl phosphate hydrolysis family protein [Faecousia sp.]
MAYYNQDWEELGRNIQDIVDRAVKSQDYQKLNQTITQTVNKAVDLGTEAVRKAVDSASKAADPQPKVKTSVVVEKQNLPALYGSTSHKTTVGVLKTVFGGLLSCLTFVIFLSTMLVNLVSGGSLLGVSSVLTLIGFGGGVGLIASGVRNLSWVNRFKTYRKVLGQKTYCTLEKLARSVGKSVKSVRKELQGMIDQGLFLEGHMDKEQTTLITSHETYREFEHSRLLMEQSREDQRRAQEAERKAQEAAAKARTEKSTDPRVQEVLDRGNAFLVQIRKCNDAIPGEEISGKISRMELIVRRIFERAEAHPEIVPDLKKMMDYYLPMTVKLLNAYADMDAQPVQGQTIQASKREIEATLDTLNLAFEKLLDDLYREAAMDVSSDISVLNTLLAQEGLTEDDLTKMKKQQKL